jgi:hypothetical protein
MAEEPLSACKLAWRKAMRKNNEPDKNRRKFLINACGVGIGAAAGASGLNRAWARAETVAASGPSAIPLRPFGKTGIDVPILGFGGSLNLMDRQLLLDQAFKMGVRYWDTADNYSGGRSEAGIGEYFGKHPEDRPHVFLVTKTSSATPQGLEDGLTGSLEQLQTDYVDLFLVHALARVQGEIDEDTRRWVDQAKADGRIRLFGFSTHRNMATCLSQAARLNWIDGIMLTYNYRLMSDGDMQRAVSACVRGGIGLVAMKTQARALSLKGLGRGGDLVQRFLDRGLTKYQARLKAVWENPQIASICSHMDNMTILKENVAAAVDRTALSTSDHRLLARHARRTASAYCAGCGDICEALLDDPLPVSDVMRCLMYAHSYNDYQMARDAFAQLPPRIRERLMQADFSAAEARCPQRIAIGKFMRRAAAELG